MRCTHTETSWSGPVHLNRMRAVLFFALNNGKITVERAAIELPRCEYKYFGNDIVSPRGFQCGRDAKWMRRSCAKKFP